MLSILLVAYPCCVKRSKRERERVGKNKPINKSKMSSWPIKSRVYQRLLYVLTNQIAEPGFLNFQLRLSLDSEDGFRTGCRNVSRKKESFSGLH